MRRFLPTGLTRAGQRVWESLRTRTIQVPVSEETLAPLTSNLDDPTLRDVRLRIRPGARLEVSGMKKMGVWVPFTATFAATPPPPEAGGQAVDLYLESAEPFFARRLMLRALADMPDLEVSGERVRVHLENLVERQDWARAIPRTVRERVRVAGVDTDQQQRLLVTFGWEGTPQAE